VFNYTTVPALLDPRQFKSPFLSLQSLQNDRGSCMEHQRQSFRRRLPPPLCFVEMPLPPRGADHSTNLLSALSNDFHPPVCAALRLTPRSAAGWSRGETCNTQAPIGVRLWSGDEDYGWLATAAVRGGKVAAREKACHQLFVNDIFAVFFLLELDKSADS